jgi:hypothetical protein
MTLPTITDFTIMNPPEQDLDGFAAWKNFGGLSLEEAYIRLCENPEARQEDFMWMGDAAFIYYFPVIDRYIREVESKASFDNIAWIVAHCIDMHVSETQPEARRIYRNLEDLAAFVLGGLAGVPRDEERAHAIDDVQEVWVALKEKLRSQQPAGG